MPLNMSVIDKINALDKKISTLRALIQGSFKPDNLYSLIGNQVIFGCLVTEGYSAADFTLALVQDPLKVNPDQSTPALRPQHYANIANIYGRSFYMQNVNTSILDNENLIISDPPATEGTARHDLVYLYINDHGPNIGILQGDASVGCQTSFIANGLEEGEYPQTYDPINLPNGCMVIARVYIQYGDTGIANARIADLRSFVTRLKTVDYEPGEQGPAGEGVPSGGSEGQFILKQSATDYDTAWEYVSANDIGGVESTVIKEIKIVPNLPAEPDSEILYIIVEE